MYCFCLSSHRHPTLTNKFGPVLLGFLLITYCALTNSTWGHAQSINHKVFTPLIFNEHDPAWYWLPEQTFTLSPSPNFGHEPLLSLDHLGGAHLIWDTYSSPRFIYHLYQTTQGWAEISPISSSLGYSEILFPPVFGANNTLHLLWRNWLGTGQENPYRLLYASFDGSKWSHEEELLISQYSDIQGMVTRDDAGGVRATLLESNFLSTNITQRTLTETGWTQPKSISPEHAISLIWPDMSGGIHLYGSKYPDLLIYSYWKNDRFYTSARELPESLPSLQSQLDGENNNHFYGTKSVPTPGGTVTGLYHQCLDRDLFWHEMSILSGQNAISGTPKVGSDSYRNVVFAWQETNSSKIDLAIFMGCLQTDQASITLPNSTHWVLAATALGYTPRQVCLLVRALYTSDYTLYCANY